MAETEAKKEKGLGKKERIEIIKKFTEAVLKKHGDIIRSVVLFGSTARGTAKGPSDIDIFIIVDDTRNRITPEMKEKLEDDFDVIAKSISKQLSIQQPYLLTEFWKLVREGHPIVFNFIREGIPVFDKDIFTPIKRLLQMGEIRPSKEAVEKFLERGPNRIKRVESAKTYMVVEDCYYAMVETAQAVLMFIGHSPPRPAEIPDVLRKTVGQMKLLEESYIKDIEDIIDLRKKVEHNEIKEITGQQLDHWIEKTKNFVKKMQTIIAKIEILKRASMVEKSHAIMADTVMTLLKAMGKTVKPEELASAFKKHLIEPGLISENYLDVFNSLENMLKLVKTGKVMEIPKSDILMHREYVRKFIREASKVLKKHIPEDHRLEE
jgi:predicted nucleotidyltransferase/uncharacterized protein (UPF0332 family)